MSKPGEEDLKLQQNEVNDPAKELRNKLEGILDKNKDGESQVKLQGNDRDFSPTMFSAHISERSSNIFGPDMGDVDPVGVIIRAVQPLKVSNITDEKLKTSALNKYGKFYIKTVENEIKNLPYDKKEKFLDAISEHYSKDYPHIKELNDGIKKNYEAEREPDGKLDTLIDDCSNKLIEVKEYSNKEDRKKAKDALARYFVNGYVEINKLKKLDPKQKEEMVNTLQGNFKTTESPKQAFFKFIVKFSDKFGLKDLANTFREKIDIQHKKATKEVFLQIKKTFDEKKLTSAESAYGNQLKPGGRNR